MEDRMTVSGADYAFTDIDEATFAAAGFRFAGRYVGPGSPGKLLTAAERDALFAHGIDIMVLVEGLAGDAFLGRAKGVQHASQALNHLATLGAPRDCALYFAVDKDATLATWPRAAEYLRGAASVVGVDRVGVYGERDVMVWATKDHVASYLFQTYAWSGGQWYPGNHVEQYRNGVHVAGGVVDLCRAKQPNFGQWRAPQIAVGGDDMTPLQDAKLSDCLTILTGMANGVESVPVHDKDGVLSLAPFYKRIAEEVAQLPAGGLDPAAIAKAVNDDAARRMAL
jgi:hypothetical protein